MAKTSKAAQTPQYSAGGRIINNIAPQLGTAIQSNILNPANSNALTQRNIAGSIMASNANYGARGLAGSGIAIRGAQQAAQDILLNSSDQQAKNIVGVLQAGSGAPTTPQQPTPRGVFGLK